MSEKRDETSVKKEEIESRYQSFNGEVRGFAERSLKEVHQLLILESQATDDKLKVAFYLNYLPLLKDMQQRSKELLHACATLPDFEEYSEKYPEFVAFLYNFQSVEALIHSDEMLAQVYSQSIRETLLGISRPLLYEGLRAADGKMVVAEQVTNKKPGQQLESFSTQVKHLQELRTLLIDFTGISSDELSDYSPAKTNSLVDLISVE
ncbi:MAG: hypothetical protein WDZ94_00115 [Patescibacteria group bacterium]